MALARPKPAAIAEPLTAPLPSPGRLPFPRDLRAALPMLAPLSTEHGHLRRCTFRRLETSAHVRRGRVDVSYRVECLYWDTTSPLPLGDLQSARPICDACAATGIFRPDED